MNLLERFVRFLQVEAQKPTDYGWFHLMFFAIVIASSILLGVFARKVSDKKFRIIIASLWGLIVLLEIVKQLIYSYHYETESWDYQWYAFPYQFCSSPLYVLPLVAFLKDCKIRDASIIFIATFSFFAGVCVYFAPGDVFNTRYLAVQIQTMVHHGVQIVLGIYSVIYCFKKFNLKTFLYSIIVFAVMLIVAIILNVVMYNVIDETFNMFFISPYYECTLPILGEIYKSVPYIIFFFVYTFGFSLCALIVYGVYQGVYKIINKLRKKTCRG